MFVDKLRSPNLADPRLGVLEPAGQATGDLACTYVCVYIYIYIYIYIHMCMYIHICIYTYISSQDGVPAGFVLSHEYWRQQEH